MEQNCPFCGDLSDKDHGPYCSATCEALHGEMKKTVGIGSPPVPRVEVPPPPSETPYDPFPSPPAPAPGPGGLKFDDDKLPLHLLPFDSLIEIAKVLKFGAKKYAPNNWRKGIAYGRLFRAATGHLIWWWMGEDLDPETGLSHLAHAGCCVVFLLHFVLTNRNELDNRQENNA